MKEMNSQGRSRPDTIRQMVDGFDKEKLNLEAVNIRSGDSYPGITYGELQEQVKTVGNVLLQMGVKKGDALGILSENRVEWTLVYLAVASIGAVIVPLDIFLEAEELVNLAKAGDIKKIFTSKYHIEKLLSDQAVIEDLEHIFCFDEHQKIYDDIHAQQETFKETIDALEEKELDVDIPFAGYKFVYFNSILNTGKKIIEKGIDKYSQVVIEPTDTSAMIYMHGKKFAMLSHGGIMANAAAIVERLSENDTYFQAGDKWLASLPFHHTYPVMMGFIVPFLTYGTTTILSRFKAKELIQTMIETGMNYMATVPLLMEGLYKAAVKGLLKLDSLKFFISGGGSIHENVLAGLNERGFTLLQGYGLTEYSPVISTTWCSDNRIGSIGPTLPGVEVRIDNPDDRGNGEILAKGPSLMKGYYKMPEATAKIIDEDGWLHTGDIGRMDDDGFIYITGRCKDILVNKGGKNIYPEDIETLLEKSDYIAQAVIVPKISMEHGEYPHAILYPDFEKLTQLEKEEKKRFSGEELTKLFQNEIKEVTHKKAPYKIPVGFEISYEEISAETAREKIFMFEDSYKRTAGEEGNAPVEKEKAVPELSQEARDQVSEVYAAKIEDYLVTRAATMLSVGKSDVDVHENFLELLDSSELVSISETIEEETGVKLHPTILFEHTNLHKLSRYFAREFRKEFKTWFGDAINEEKIIQSMSRSAEDAGLSVQKRPETSKRQDSNLSGKYGKRASDIPVAIIGIAGVFPRSKNLDEFWENLEAGRDLISEIPSDRWDYRKYYGDPLVEDNKANAKWGGFIDDIDKFDTLFFNISPREAELMDPQQRIFLEVVYKSIEDAGCSHSSLSGTMTGLFVGVATHDYGEVQDHNLGSIEAYTSTGYAHCILANRISYLLDIHGASEPIDTACASSLFAVHRAAKAIREGECEMAIAGGVNALLSPKLFVSFGKAGMLSPDGRCQTFSKDANGYVRGEGAAAVFLKPLNKAIEDGHYIYAIIKASAVNHGGHANSLTAPNPNIQAELLSTAYSTADVPPDTVSYLEAHGTGTPLGDPIEVNGMRKAFDELYKRFSKKQDRVNYCGIGSVKTNIGHLETAAGIAGLIKVVLAIKHKKIPASINFSRLNSYIQLDDSPFYVVQETKEWERFKDENGLDIPRRAGVSSFGFGGANSHVVLEEYENPLPSPEWNNPGSGVILLSAKNEDRLKDYARLMIDFLEKTEHDKTIALDNIAYTLQTGRDRMDERLALVVGTVRELVEKLNGFLDGKDDIEDLYRGSHKNRGAKTEFFVTGEEGELFLQTLINNRKLGKLAQLWGFGISIDWEALYPDGVPNLIPLPTYPFARERYWIDEPEKHINILEGRKTRGAKLHTLIDRNISTLQEQAYTKVFTQEEFYLRDHVINGRSILAGTACLEMARAAGELAGEQPVQSIRDFMLGHPIEILPGELEKEVTTNLFYDDSEILKWEVSSFDPSGEKLIHGSGELEFGDGYDRYNYEQIDIETIKQRLSLHETGSEFYSRLDQIGFNFGPAHQSVYEVYGSETEALSKLILPEEIRSIDDFILNPSLLDGCMHTGVWIINETEPVLLFYIGDVEIFQPLNHTVYYVHVMLLDTGQKNNDTNYKKFNLDVYDEEGRLVVRIKENLGRKSARPAVEDEMEYISPMGIYYKPVWQRVEIGSVKSSELNSVVIFDHNENVFKEFKEYYPRAILVKPAGSYRDYGDNIYEIDPGSKDDYTMLINSFIEKKIPVNSILHLWNYSHKDLNLSSAEELRAVLTTGIYSLFLLSQVLMEMKTGNKIKLLYIHYRSKENIQPWNSAVGGFIKTINQENPQYEYHMIRLDRKNISPTEFFNISVKEFANEDSRAMEVQYTGSERMIKSLLELEIGEPEPEQELSFKQGGVYCITGGTGGLGLIFAGYLSEKYHASLILTGRSDLDDSRRQAIEKINEKGGEAFYVSADVSNTDSLKRALKEGKEKFGELNGIIHAAGVLDDSFILKKSMESFSKVLLPKIQGTVNLDIATKDEKLDFFVLFSSITSIFGNTGQADYAAGNSFMDAFADYRNALVAMGNRDGSTISINWPLWREGGMDIGSEMEEYIKEKTGMSLLEVPQGIEAFEHALRLKEEQFIVYDGEVSKYLAVEDDKELFMKTENYLIELLARELKIPEDRVDPTVTFEEYGIDSLMMARLSNQLKDDFNGLPATLFCDYTTIHELVGYFIEFHKTLLKKILHYKGKPVSKTLLEEAETYLKKNLSQELKIPINLIDSSHTFDEYGLDSLIVVKLTNKINRDFGNLPETMFIQYKNIYSLAEYLIENHSESLKRVIQFEKKQKEKKDKNQYQAAAEKNKCALPSRPRDLITEDTQAGEEKKPEKSDQVQIDQLHTVAYAREYSPEEPAKEAGTPVQDDRELLRKAEEYLLDLFSRVTKISKSRLNPKDELEKYGIDSLMIMNLSRQMEKDFGKIPKTLFFEYTNIHDLAGYLLENFNDQLLTVLQGGRPPVEKSTPSTPPLVKQPREAAPITDDKELLQKTEEYLLDLFSRVTKISKSRLNPKDELEKYGIDSLMIMNLSKQMEKDFEKLPKTLFFEYTNIHDLANYLIENHRRQLETIFQMEKGADADISGSSPRTIQITEKTSDSGMENEQLKHSKLPSKPFKKDFSDRGEYEPEEIAGVVKDIAIIGISGRYPQADTIDEYWNNLKEGKDCITEIPEDRWDHTAYFNPEKNVPGKTYGKWGGFIGDVDKFDSLFFNISPREAELLDPQERLFLETVWHTLEDGGTTRAALKGSKVGVFVGVMWGHYQLFGVEESLKGNVIAPSSSYASIANRVSYFFNFHGPSISVDTMCSSSLTAVHMACESIYMGSSDYAIAGGVNLSIHSAKYLQLGSGMFLASDGRCKSFGEGGDGYVPGEGVGAVLLKPLNNARIDRDRVYAVIKGTSVNHGGKTNGYSVPSPNAQAELITEALKKAKIDARTISYVEAHGTGTSLGDPIEMAGLTKSYSKYTQEKQYCAIGSAKSNIGHLESAAGIAALTKVLLQFQYRQLLPSIHSKKLNPNIDFEDTPFYVIRELKEWKRPVITEDEERKTYPRRAGISAFGAGGSNAHLILEEFENPEQQLNTEILQNQLIILSAKNMKQLKIHAKNMADYLNKAIIDKPGKTENEKNIFLLDMAYTLQVGREALDERLAIIVNDIENLAEKLTLFCEEERDIEGVYSGNVKIERDKFELLIEGKAGEEFIKIIIDEQDMEKLAQLWIAGVDVDWGLRYVDSKPNRISLPGYPFESVSHWIPEAGEVTGAPGHEKVLTLHPLIGRNTSNFNELKFSTELTGNEFFLADQVAIPGAVYIEMARAAGEISGEMEVQKIKDFVWVKPLSIGKDKKEIHTSLFLNRDEVEFEIFTNSESEQRELHAVGKIIYGHYAGIQSKSEPVNIESVKQRCPDKKTGSECYELFTNKGFMYGSNFQIIRELHNSPTEGLSLIELPAHISSGLDGFVLHPVLMDGAMQTVIGFMANIELKSDAFYIPVSSGEIEIINPLPQICYIYISVVGERNASGYDIKIFNILFLDEKGNELVKIYNFSIRALQDSEKNEFTGKQDTPATLFYGVEWEKSALELKNLKNESPGHVLIFDTDEILWNALKEQVGFDDEVGTQFILVKPGESYQHLAHQVYQINPENQDDYLQLLTTLKKQKFSPGKILHAWTAHSSGDDEYDSGLKIFNEIDENIKKEFFEKSLTIGIYSLFHLIKVLSITGIKSVNRILFAFNGEKKASSLFMESAAGYSKSLSLIYPALSFSTIKIVRSGKERKTDAEIIINELKAKNKEIGSEIRYIADQRYLKQVIPRKLDDSGNQLLKMNGVYLITGGAGALGFIFARHLAEKYKAKLVLMGRSKPDSIKNEKIESLKQFGADVVYMQADAANLEEMKAVVKTVREKFGNINGVIHSAGTAGEKIIIQKEIDEFSKFLHPKIHGTIVLDEATKDENLDFMVLFSSTSAVLGDFGQCDYSIGNRFLDSYVDLREELREKKLRHGKTISINWPLWKEGGMHMSEEAESLYLQTSGMSYLETEVGVNAFDAILQSTLSQVLLISGIEKRVNRFVGIEGSENEVISLAKTTQSIDKPVKTKVEKFTPAATEGMPVERRIQLDIQKIASTLLKVDFHSMNDINENLGNFGFDSISLKGFANMLSETYNVEVSPTVFFSHLSIKSLSSYLLDEFEEIMNDFYRQTEKTEKTGIEPEIQHIEEEEIIAEKPFVPFSERFKGSERFTLRGKEEVAIIGISGIFPQSENIEKFWRNLENGKDLVTEIPIERWDWRDYYGDPLSDSTKSNSKWGGFIPDVDKFDAQFFKLSPREVELMDPQHRLFLKTAWEAIEDGGYKASSLSGKTVGVFVGVQFIDYAFMLTDAGEASAQVSTGNAHSLLPNRVSFLLNFRGPSEAIDTACSSSLVAVHQAVKSVQNGESEAAIAGGVSLNLSPKILINTAQLGVLSSDGRCKTFDKSANGYVRGEGVGAILLKPLTKALEDHDHIYAIIKGSAINHGGKASSLTAPNSEAQAELLMNAFEEAAIDVENIAYMEAHGTGTELGDPIEIEGLKKAFKDYAKKHDKNISKKNYCGIGSVKTNIGHLEPASGIAGLIKVILAMKYKKMPGILNFKEINPYINLENSPFYIVKGLKKWEPLQDERGNDIPRLAGVSSFGFGGANSHIILEEYREPFSKKETQNNEPQLIVLSAKNKERLQEYARNLAEFLRGEDAAAEKQPGIETAGMIESSLLQFASEIINVGVDEIDVSENMNEYGFDPITVTEFGKQINGKFDLDIKPAIFSDYSSINALVEFLDKEYHETFNTYYSDSMKEEKIDPDTDKKINFTDIAFTLQMGREEMEERLAIVVSNRDDLIERLKEYYNNKENIQNVYCGNVKKNASNYEIIIDEQEGEDFIKNLINKKKINKLAQLWIGGIDIDWDLLYINQNPKRVSLPTYAFAKDRYWMSIAAAGTEESKSKIKIEPLSPPAARETDTLDFEKNVQNDTIAIIAEVLKVKQDAIDIDTEIAEYGADSIVLIRIANMLSELYDAAVQPKVIAEIPTIRSLVQHLIDTNLVNEDHYSRAVSQEKHIHDELDLKEEVQRDIITIFSEVLKVKQDTIDIDTEITEYGADSIVLIRIANMLSELYDAAVQPKVIAEIPTIRSLVQHLIDTDITNEKYYIRKEVPKEKAIDKKVKTTVTFDNTAHFESERSREVKENFKSDNIFITGTTGVLGTYILKELLLTTKANIYALVRAKDKAHGLERIKKTLLSYGKDDALFKEFDKRVTPVIGDITEDKLGLAEDEYKKLAGIIDVTFHSAASTNLMLSYKNLELINLSGTRNMVDFVLETEQKYIMNTSSYSAMGDLIYKSNVCFKEDDLDVGQKFPKLGYARTKLECEQIVREATPKGLIWNNVRPGNIYGDSQTGLYPFDLTGVTGVYYELFELIVKTGIAISGINHVDMTPVDFIAKSMIYLALEHHDFFKTYHLVNPDLTTWNDVMKILMDYGYTVNMITPEDYFALLESDAFHYRKSEKDQMVISLMRYGSAIKEMYENDGYAATDYTASVLKKAGITCPKMDINLVETYLSQYIKMGQLDAPADQKPNLDKESIEKILNRKINF
ncbi:MAG: SDR family NAD(P)-dependent oxidoreductase, partial [bacterium]|nr:SDR family NAD(P)-dependent oxidoreductase [bacterium]